MLVTEEWSLAGMVNGERRTLKGCGYGTEEGVSMVVCGGGALLTGLDQLLAHETLMPVRVAPDPLTCVVRGTGIVLEEIDTLNRVLLRTRKMRALRY